MTENQIANAIIALCASGIVGILIYAAYHPVKKINKGLPDFYPPIPMPTIPNPIQYKDLNGPPVTVKHLINKIKVTAPEGYYAPNRAKTVTFTKKPAKDAKRTKR